MKRLKAFKMALLGIWGNKFRVLLSIFGIVIAVFAVIVLHPLPSASKTR